MHVNHLGAPVAATNKQGQTIWQADYAPYGKVIKTSLIKAGKDGASAVGELAYTLALRLPGQWEDEESGLYYNDFRYYDPQAGRYLSPDPLGRLAEAMGSPNAYAYVNNNPLSYIDPWGLILFAFDGTGNTEASRTNVLWFMEAYNDNDPYGIAEANKPYYVKGVGTDWWAVGDAAVTYTMKSRIETQLGRLDNYVKAKLDDEIDVRQNRFNAENPLIITLDIVGFSRGSAAARDFANTVINRKNSGYYRDLVGGGCVGIKIRFMGLFDTVISTAFGSFNLGIPSQIEYVAHAVAANEHRKLFPLESIEGSYGGRGFDSSRVERGFIGAHSDIGGGYDCEGSACDKTRGDLSDVSLNWMVQQAVKSGVPMIPLNSEQQTITSPILHSEIRTFPFDKYGADQDRDVRYPDQAVKQRDADFEGMNYVKSLDGGFITFDAMPTGDRQGVVDMDKYKAWLADNYGLTLQ